MEVPRDRLGPLQDRYHLGAQPGAGTVLIESQAALWSRLGVAEVRATASGVGSCAFAAWGFGLARADSMTPPREVREELRRRAGLGKLTSSSPGVPEELVDELDRLLHGQDEPEPLLDIGAIYRLTTDAGERFGAGLLSGVMWPARLRLTPICGY